MRSIAGAGLAVSLGIGGWTASSLTSTSEAETEALLAKRVSPEQAQRQALESEASYAGSEALYLTYVDDAVREHDVAAPGRERLLAPNPFHHPITPEAPHTVAAGGSWSGQGFEVRVQTEAIETENRGIRAKTQHTMVELENVGSVPVAYLLDVHAVEGDCKARALTRFNAMALRPGEKGEISICAGVRDVEIRDLRLLEVTELGAVWVSKVPALAAGYDSVVARSHFPGNGIEMCASIPGTEIAGRIAAGEFAWEDLVDFYSRHDCEHYRWSPTYRRSDTPLEQLPYTDK